MNPRERVRTALRHEEPDRVPVDFLATPDVWRRLIEHVLPDTAGVGCTDFIEADREALLRHFEVDTRVLSYDMFCKPPDESDVEWWSALDRSTPNRMWRRRLGDGTTLDIWGCHRQRVEHGFGAYEEFASWPLQNAQSLDELASHPWPDPGWWDFDALPALLDELAPFHVRFRIGSVFEIGWQLRGMQEFLIDLAINPEIPSYIMGRLSDVYVENTRRVLELVGDRLDMVYFYDDVATQNSLMISPDTWRELVRPHHARLCDLAHSYGVPVMYHCDGAIYPLIPEVIDMGVDLLNPIQPDAKGMEAQRLKDEFGDRLSFHGGVDILRILPSGTVDEVRAEVRRLVATLGKGGGFVLCSSHHLQPDTPLENVLAMYDVALRYR
jgi:uroporphyrinogen decarboxylase